MEAAADPKAYFCWSDISTWASLLDATPRGASSDDVGMLLQQLYVGYRAFHGCKSLDVESYRSQGLLAHDRRILHDQVKARILTAHPEIDPKDIDQSIVQATRGEGEPEVCAFIDRRFLEGDAKEFCIRGSEMPRRVAAILRGYSDIDVAPVLTQPGTPTIVEFGVAWINGPPHIMKHLPNEVHAALEPARRGNAPRVIDDPHVQRKTVPPSMIFAISHPVFADH